MGLATNQVVGSQPKLWGTLIHSYYVPVGVAQFLHYHSTVERQPEDCENANHQSIFVKLFYVVLYALYLSFESVYLRVQFFSNGRRFMSVHLIGVI